MNHGQMSLETLLAIVLLLFFFITALAFLFQINSSSIQLQEQAEQWNECTRLAGLIQEIFIQGPGTQLATTVSNSFSVSNYSVYLQEAQCNFTAAIGTGSFSDGNVVLTNLNGVVMLRNE